MFALRNLCLSRGLWAIVLLIVVGVVDELDHCVTPLMNKACDHSTLIHTQGWSDRMSHHQQEERECG
jgi:hypothetical protein